MTSTTFSQSLEVPSGVQATLNKGVVTIKGPKGEVSKAMNNPHVEIKIEGTTLRFLNKRNKTTRREKKQIYAYLAHANNMVKGVQQPYVYKVKVCAGHFPINVALSGKSFSVKNFLGEKVPRIITLKDNVKVEIAGEIITITSCDVERAGQTAADLEQLTRVTNRDLRIFQDGLYIIEKCGEKVA